MTPTTEHEDREQATPRDAMLAAKMLIGAIQWSKDGGTDMTGWGVCPDCSADDWRGHKEGCTVVKVLAQLDQAVNSYDSLLATNARLKEALESIRDCGMLSSCETCKNVARYAIASTGETK